MTLPIALALVGSLFAAAALAQDHSGHRGPASTRPHQGHGAAVAPTTANEWSYLGRDNPKPATRNRWVMVPGESGAMYRSAKDMTPEQRCKALLGNPRTIVDDATRAACGRPAAAPAPAAPAHTDHSQHR
jgi:hypothetical protein